MKRSCTYFKTAAESVKHFSLQPWNPDPLPESPTGSRQPRSHSPAHGWSQRVPAAPCQPSPSQRSRSATDSSFMKSSDFPVAATFFQLFVYFLGDTHHTIEVFQTSSAQELLWFKINKTSWIFHNGSIITIPWWRERQVVESEENKRKKERRQTHLINK